MSVSRRQFLQGTIGGAAMLRSTMQNTSQKPDVTFLSISELSELIRNKKVSPVEVTRATLDRIEKLNPKLNAYITVTRDIAMKAAQDAEAEIQQKKWRGPLHGIPIALKDLFDTAGIKTTAGSNVFKDRVPSQDAEVVRRLKAAGAVLVGKTNMHEFAFGGSSLVTAFGGVHNPWDINRIAGGSSGGSASAVAAGLCYGALGSDTAGSIRMPASYCALAGLKPTYGLVSTRGVVPLSWSLDHVGPMTRTVADSAILLQAIAGYDPEEITSVRMNVPNYSMMLARKAPSIRIGVAREFFFENLEPEIQEAVNRSIAVLQKVFSSVTEVTIPARDQEDLRATVRLAEAYAYHADFMAKTPELYQPETLARLRPGVNANTISYIHGRRQLDRTRRQIVEVFQNVDVIVTPTSPVSPPPIALFAGDRNGPPDYQNASIRNTSPFNVYGWPTISVPCGFTTNALPIGLQISAAPGNDAVVLQVAYAFEQATDWHKRRPINL
jgi:aspartyl-tRNA(Asn)/glutamyl-tRNA(Gln) amidotransferase subunit A